MDIPNFNTKKEVFDYLVENKDKIITTRKAVMKRGDDIPHISIAGFETKAVAGISSDADKITVTAIINTTNVMDSHKDVHISGIWKKSIKENKNILHIQEHQLQFDKIIAEGIDLKAYTKEYSFKQLGYNLDGNTEALVFESTIKREENPFMFNKYKSGKVKNHSVGMHYVKLALAINDSDYPSEKAVWDKYYSSIANKEAADDSGYFWAITEAKIIEGSAVPLGSNIITPTLSVESKEEPDTSTRKDNEPSDIDTQKAKEIIKQFFKN